MSDPCNRCKREGLAILPVIYAAVPNNHRYYKKKEAKGRPGGNEQKSHDPTTMNAIQPEHWPAPPSGQFGMGVTTKVLDESDYILRSPERGYIYLLYPDGRWVGYLVDPRGYLQYYPDLSLEDMPEKPPEESKAENCERQYGKKHAGAQALCIEGVDKLHGKTVYIAYSRYKWTKAVRACHAANPARRMQAINKFDGSVFDHAERATGDNIARWVADYRRGAAGLINPLLPADAQITDRSGTASLEGLVLRMRELSHQAGRAANGLVMALHDPVGLTRSLNLRRTQLAAEAYDAAGGNDEKKARRRLVAETIKTIFESAKADPGPWFAPYYGPERFQRHVDMAKLDEALTLSARYDDLQKRIPLASADYIKWQGSDQWDTIQSWDFDPESTSSVRNHETMVCECIVASGLDNSEFDQVWERVMSLDAKDPKNWFVRSVGALDVGFAEYVSQQRREDKLGDIAKRIATASYETYKTQLEKAEKAAEKARKEAQEEVLRASRRAENTKAQKEALAKTKQLLAQAEKQAAEWKAKHAEATRARIQKNLDEILQQGKREKAEAEELAKMHERLSKRRAATAATSQLINQATAVLARFQKRDPQGYKKLMRTVSAALVVRASHVPQPVVVIGTPSQLADAMYEGAAIKPPSVEGTDAEIKVDRSPAKTYGSSEAGVLPGVAQRRIMGSFAKSRQEVEVFIAFVLVKLSEGAKLQPHEMQRLFGTQVLDLDELERSRAEAQEVARARAKKPVLLQTPGSASGKEIVYADPMTLPPVPAPSQPGSHAPAPTPRPAIPPLPAPAPTASGRAQLPGLTPAPENPFVVNQRVRFHAKVDMGFTGFAMFFQMYAAIVSIQSIQASESGSEDELYGRVNLSAASLALVASGLELKSAAHLMQGNAYSASRLLRIAGGVSVVAGLIEAGPLWSVGWGKVRQGGEGATSGWAYIGSGVAIFLGGAAAAGLNMAAAAGLSTSVAAGATGVAVGGQAAGAATFLHLGVVPWTIIVVALVGAGIYLHMRAVGLDPEVLEPIEYWLDSGTFGKRAFCVGERYKKSPYYRKGLVEQMPFQTLQEECFALQKILYAPRGKLVANQEQTFTIGVVNQICQYGVVLPYCNVNTRLEIAVYAVEKKLQILAAKWVYEGFSTEPSEINRHPGLGTYGAMGASFLPAPVVQADIDAGMLRVAGTLKILRYLPDTSPNDPASKKASPKDPKLLYADHVKMMVKYWPDQVNMPEHFCDFQSPQDA